MLSNYNHRDHNHVHAIAHALLLILPLGVLRTERALKAEKLALKASALPYADLNIRCFVYAIPQVFGSPLSVRLWSKAM